MSWQLSAIQDIKAMLEPDQDVRGLVLVGSYTRSDDTTDIWSDVDMVLVATNHAFDRFYPETEWLSRLGEPYCVSQNSNGAYAVTRVYYVDGRRVDFVIIGESALDEIEDLPSNPLRYMNESLFSRSPILDRVLARTYPPPELKPFTKAQLERMANDFWFKGMLAVSKVGRDELLVALHLSLDMVRDCLVLGMLIRDKETGTDHHRDGSEGNHLVGELADACKPFTREGILASIEESAQAFDRLASRLIEGYQNRRGPLLDWIAAGRSCSDQ